MTIDTVTNANCGYPSANRPNPELKPAEYPEIDLANSLPIMWPYTGPGLNLWWELSPETRRTIHAKAVATRKTSAEDLRALVSQLAEAQQSGGSVEAVIEKWGAQ